MFDGRTVDPTAADIDDVRDVFSRGSRGTPGNLCPECGGALKLIGRASA